MLDLDYAYLSRTGGRERNEDACGYWLSDKGCCWVVADGAGGHGSGDRAAQLVVSSILEDFARLPCISESDALALLETAQSAVMGEKAAHRDGDDMHATAALLLLDARQGKAVWSHAGDSRIYLFREGKLLLRTRDHSLLQNLIDAGYCANGQERGHPMRSLLTSAIGNAEDLELTASGSPIAVVPGDAFLICSDGWWEHVDEACMSSQLASASSAANWLESMAAVVEAEGNGSSDNYTAIALRLNPSNGETTIIPG